MKDKRSFNNFNKRIISLILTVLMLASSLPFSVFADEADPHQAVEDIEFGEPYYPQQDNAGQYAAEPDAVQEYTEPESVPAEPLGETYSGTCGNNLTWTLDTGTGVMTISGTGGNGGLLSLFLCTLV